MHNDKRITIKQMQKIQVYYNCLTEFSKFLRLSEYILYRNKIEKANF